MKKLINIADTEHSRASSQPGPSPPQQEKITLLLSSFEWDTVQPVFLLLSEQLHPHHVASPANAYDMAGLHHGKPKSGLIILCPFSLFCSCVLHPKIFLPFSHSFLLLLLKNKSLSCCLSWLSQEQPHMHLYKRFALVFSTSYLNP